MAQVTMRSLNKMYDEVHAVKDVNLDIRDKEFVVLVGPSGCGKTTTLRMVAGLESITSGRVLIDDKVVNELAPMDRDIAMVFQNYALYPHMIGLRQHGLRPQNAEIRQARDPEAGARGRRHPGHRRVSETQAAAAVGRPAPARRLGAGDRAPPAGLSVRRAVIESRRQTARPDAGRAEEIASAPRHDRDLCDA